MSELSVYSKLLDSEGFSVFRLHSGDTLLEVRDEILFDLLNKPVLAPRGQVYLLLRRLVRHEV